ncbi:hypothetical protein [Actinomadura vinacea]|uniref:hypothetical protein n=1 Tax=Actinomadura vinacea TaxID=115336 RepID=UPI0031DB49E6
MGNQPSDFPAGASATARAWAARSAVKVRFHLGEQRQQQESDASHTVVGASMPKTGQQV